MRQWRHLTPDSGCAELRWSASYAERIGHLLATSVAIALPGGVGTLAEAAGVWAAAQTEPGAAQLVLVGPAWRSLMHVFARELVVGEQDLALPVLVEEVGAAIYAVRRLLDAPAAALGARG
jgi:predicted Rossmann-fold nucleotide-binding protein